MIKGTAKFQLVAFKVWSLSSNFGDFLEVQILQILRLYGVSPEICVLTSLLGGSHDQ